MIDPTPRSFVDKLVELDGRETRQRLAEVMAACRAKATQIDQLQGQGLLDRVGRAERDLRLAAREAIKFLDASLAEYSQPWPQVEPAMPAAPEPAAVQAAPAPTQEPRRPTMPPRAGIRLPPRKPS